MTPLCPPDSHYLSAAKGWLMLGDPVAAGAELACLASSAQSHPDALDLQWQVSAAARDWATCLRVADQFIAASPEDKTGWVQRSYALHELKRTQEAWESLRPMAERHPEEPIIAYNLACYACQLGRPEEAWRWLETAAQRSSPESVRTMAGTDPDLRPLWPQLPRLTGKATA